MASDGDVRIEGLTRFLFTAPSWRRSLAIIIILGIVIDGAGLRTGRAIHFFGTFGYILPALASFLLTKPLVEFFGKSITWNRSALLAMACVVFGVITSLSPILLVVQGIFPLLFALSLGVIFAIRLLVLVAIADYRISRMLLPAATQSIVGVLAGTMFFGFQFTTFALVLHLLFGSAIILFIWLVERPLKRNFHISALNFINAFIAHNTDGSMQLETFFREIGEAVYVPQTSIFFRREGGNTALLTVPNVHPGPMGEIGGGNLPLIIHDALGKDTFVAHGCATHDFNLVSSSEVDKIITAVRDSADDLRYTSKAGKSCRFEYGSVHVLAQPIGDTLLMIATRAPAMTEDIDYPIGLAIMAEGRQHFGHIAFIDAHNSMVDVTSPVMPASLTAYEYMRACELAVEGCRGMEVQDFSVGISHVRVPFTREEGFGDLGIQVLVVRVGNQDTAYVLFDGNNMASGVREVIREHLIGIVDECEVMTTDSHVVNTITGKNPVGYRVSADAMLPYIIDGVRQAVDDCRRAEAAGSTAWCEGIVVFGSHSVSQLASTVNAMLVYIAPLGLAITLFAFLLSFVAYVVLV
ncbi:MAG: hypothetical protein APR53_10800 [Methanoculleus sp. SDB]|nr:MAG: hypothetical protein APR53_10800 [Methanoculleus sp. SDB]